MKKCTIMLGLLVTATIGLAGCASVGNESLSRENEASVQSKMVKGKTTKTEVKDMFGSPTTASFTDGGLTIWNYELARMHADAVNFIPIVNMFGTSVSGTKKSLVVLFDDNDVVRNYSMSDSPVSTKTGLFSK